MYHSRAFERRSEGIVDLWVTDQDGIFLDESETTVAVKRNGALIGE
jgi:hypothetical protein